MLEKNTLCYLFLFNAIFLYIQINQKFERFIEILHVIETLRIIYSQEKFIILLLFSSIIDISILSTLYFFTYIYSNHFDINLGLSIILQKTRKNFYHITTLFSFLALIQTSQLIPKSSHISTPYLPKRARTNFFFSFHNLTLLHQYLYR